MTTEYVVFYRDGDTDGWKHYATLEARSSQSAIRSALDQNVTEEVQPGQFAAVPQRSWKPVTVKVETKTALKFS